MKCTSETSGLVKVTASLKTRVLRTKPYCNDHCFLWKHEIQLSELLIKDKDPI